MKWSFAPKALNPAYASNKTGGYKVRVAGIKDGSGSIEGVYDPTNPLPSQFDVGAIVTLKLYLTAAGFYTVPAIIDSLKFDVDLDTGEFVKWTADFATTGAWTNPSSGEQFEMDQETIDAYEAGQRPGLAAHETRADAKSAPSPVQSVANAIKQEREALAADRSALMTDCARMAAEAAAQAVAQIMSAWEKPVQAIDGAKQVPA